MSQPPIIPDLPPEEPYHHPLPYQQPPPVYLQPRSDVVGKSALGTVTVVAVLILIFCVLPLAFCASCGVLGSATSGG